MVSEASCPGTQQQLQGMGWPASPSLLLFLSCFGQEAQLWRSPDQVLVLSYFLVFQITSDGYNGIRDHSLLSASSEYSSCIRSSSKDEVLSPRSTSIIPWPILPPKLCYCLVIGSQSAFWTQMHWRAWHKIDSYAFVNSQIVRIQPAVKGSW